MLEVSKRFMKEQNNNDGKEKFLFPREYKWKRSETNEDYKYKKALTYLMNLLYPTVSFDAEQLTYQLINLIFFSEIK